MNKTAYLCGPISGLSYGEAVDWRVSFAQLLLPHIKVLSPMRSKSYLAEEKIIADSYSSLMSNQKAITTRDRHDTMGADMLVANLLGARKVSIGSMIELGWADAARRPICAIMEPGGLHDHAMVRELAGWVVSTIEDAAYVVNCVLSEGT